MLRLALPVVLAEIGWVGMGVVDTMMVGRIDAVSIGAVSLGRVLFIVVGVTGIGLLLGLDTLVSQAFGAGEADGGRGWLVQGVILALLITGPLMLGMWVLGGLLTRWDIEAAVAGKAWTYLRIVSLCTLPLLLYTTFRRYLQAVNLVRPVMVALLTANAVNALANWILIFGHWGAPALGTAGAAWASLAAMIYMALFLLGAVLLHDREQGWPLRQVSFAVDWVRIRRLVGLGLPAATHLSLEIGVFGLATALAARLGATPLAAHQVAINIASVTYMVPLGISSAAAVRVGQALGRGDPARASHAGWSALWLGGGFMAAAAVALVAAPHWFVRAFTPEPEVLALGASLLYVAALFQLFDGLQVVATGALRGAGDTRTPMLWNLVGYWGIALPIAYVLGFRTERGVVGIWLGLLAGLVVVGTILVVIWARRTRCWQQPGPELESGLS